MYVEHDLGESEAKLLDNSYSQDQGNLSEKGACLIERRLVGTVL